MPVLVAGNMAGIVGVQPALLPTGALWWWLAVAVSAVLGHMYTPLAGMKGGKGVATGSGALMAIYPVLTIPVLVAVLAWGTMLVITRIMSASGMVAGITVPIAFVIATALQRPEGSSVWQSLQPAIPALIVSAVVAALVIWKHRSNLARIRAGTEPRVSLGRSGRVATSAASGPKAQ